MKQIHVFSDGLYLAAATLTLLAGTAQAQNLAKFTISDEAAKKTLLKNEINAETAARIGAGVIECAKKLSQAMTTFVLTPTGQIVYAYRMDGNVPINIETAKLKAESVLYTRDSTHTRANQVANNLSLQMRWAPLGVFPTSGGLPIIVEGQMIGVIGVGGGTMDEQCAYEALTKVVGPQPPLAPPTPPAKAGQ